MQTYDYIVSGLEKKMSQLWSLNLSLQRLSVLEFGDMGNLEMLDI